MPSSISICTEKNCFDKESEKRAKTTHGAWQQYYGGDFIFNTWAAIYFYCRNLFRDFCVFKKNIFIGT